MSDAHGRQQPSDRTDVGVRAAVGEERTNAQQRDLQNVLADLWQHSETLVHQELALAKAEFEARVVHAKAAAQRGALALCLAHAAYLSTLATLVLVLALWLEPWIASLIVAIAGSGGAVFFVYWGKQELRKVTGSSAPLPRQHPQQLTRQQAHS